MKVSFIAQYGLLIFQAALHLPQVKITRNGTQGKAFPFHLICLKFCPVGGSINLYNAERNDKCIAIIELEVQLLSFNFIDVIPLHGSAIVSLR